MCQYTGGVLGDFVLVFHRDICREHTLAGRRNYEYFITKAANSLSAAGGPEISKTINRNPIANLASD